MHNRRESMQNMCRGIAFPDIPSCSRRFLCQTQTKDNINVSAVQTSNGSAAHEAKIPVVSVPIVKDREAAALIIAGKTGLPGAGLIPSGSGKAAGRLARAKFHVGWVFVSKNVQVMKGLTNKLGEFQQEWPFSFRSVPSENNLFAMEPQTIYKLPGDHRLRRGKTSLADDGTRMPVHDRIILFGNKQ